ncbi:DUF2382 domain-containing protein [Allosphingosinicella flava]|uniref:DUF2382 domain-containing protein n=1 Tax=Allosphingosinicella flava TaxID=2771430 RepID=A0A7T2GJ39_9SPHN|nr:DUF2382 domain-containing protein [Sphingosinicella flava]QPQ54468.1 DUF2382 domain-containing protein [Sphingosinicella flava]
MTEEQNLVIPLVEERVSTAKREVETGRVRLRTRVEERQEMARADLARDEVEIERVPLNVEVDAVPDVRQEGDVTIVPVVEEVLVVEKKWVLVEEIRFRRTRSHEEFAQSVTVRAQRAEVERE